LSKALLQAFPKKDKEVVVIDGKGVLTAHSYCNMSTPWLRAAMRKLIVVCYCTYHIDVVVLAVIVINHLDVNYG